MVLPGPRGLMARQGRQVPLEQIAPFLAPQALMEQLVQQGLMARRVRLARPELLGRMVLLVSTVLPDLTDQLERQEQMGPSGLLVPTAPFLAPQVLLERTLLSPAPPALRALMVHQV